MPCRSTQLILYNRSIEYSETLKIVFLLNEDFYLTWFNLVSVLLFKPYIIGFLLYIMYLVKFNSKITIIEFLLTLALIYQIGLWIELLFNSFTYFNLGGFSDFIGYMADNNPSDNILKNRDNPDYPKLIRYLSTNIAALAARRPMSRAIGLAIANAGNIMADIASNEERANYWIDQYNFYLKNGRLRGGQDGSGPFERGSNPFDNPENIGSSNNTESTSNFIGDSNFIKDLFSPVDHSIPLDTLINVHFLMNIGLFVLVIALIILTVYFYINLIILFNKDYLLIK